MPRISSFRLVTVAVMGVRMLAQDPRDGAALKGYANREWCCGHAKIEPTMKVGAYYKTAAGIFRGKLKLLNNKEIVIENDSKQMVSIRRSHKTKFLRNNLQIKPSDIDLETPVTVDTTESASVSLLAVNVNVDTPPNDHLPQSRSMRNE